MVPVKTIEYKEGPKLMSDIQYPDNPQTNGDPIQPPPPPTKPWEPWDMKPPSTNLPEELKTREAIIRRLSNLTTREAIWIDLSLHEVSNHAAQKSQTRRKWKESLQDNSRKKLPLLHSLQSGKQMSTKEAKKVLSVIRESKEIHRDYLSGKYRGGGARGNKNWHKAWLDKYKEIETKILYNYPTLETKNKKGYKPTITKTKPQPLGKHQDI